MRYPFLLQSLISFASYTTLARAFSVSLSGSPTQCGPLTVNWTGGQPPFDIVLTPAFDIPKNISVPTAAFSNNMGSYQIPVIPFQQGKNFLVTMSDATGFGTGGTSALLTVGAPVGGASCNTTTPTLPFSFGLPSSLAQCSPYVFNGYDAATMPVTITGLIPDGIPFLLHPPSDSTSFTWIADVAAGTTIIFSMTDAQGRSGGSSDTQTVVLSNIVNCLNANSPSSTASSFPSSTSAATTTTSTTHTTSTSTSVGTIVGAVAGTVIALAAIAALAVFCLRRRRRRYNRQPYGLASTRRHHSVEIDPGAENFDHPPIYPFPYQADSVSRLAPPTEPGSATASSFHYQTDSVSQLTPSIAPGSTSGSARQPHSRSGSNSEFGGFGEATSSTMSSSGRRKAEQAGVRSYQAAPRFIVHTDAEDIPPVEEEEVVELPPQYSERRGPTAGSPPGRPVSSATSTTSTDLPYTSGQPGGSSHSPAHLPLM